MSWFATPFSLRARFLAATATVVLALTLAYGCLAVVGYLASFDRTAYQLLRAESNLFFNLAQWQNNKLSINIPNNTELNYPTLVFIYDQHHNLLWSQQRVPQLEEIIQQHWLKKNGFYELDISKQLSAQILAYLPEAQEMLPPPPTNKFASRSNPAIKNQLQQRLQEYDDDDDDAMTHSIVINHYAATHNLPPLSIVVIDVIPQELQTTSTVWSWFGYLLLANFLLVIPLLWLAAYWSLRPIKKLALQVNELESGQRELLEQTAPLELRSLVNNLNTLLQGERQRYSKYHATLSDLTHSLKTPLAVLQTTLHSLRSKRITIEEAEPVMLAQISRISQQTGYYLHRASVRSEHYVISREVHSVSALLDSLCSALNKVYQRKRVSITLDVSPELTFIGEQNDFMEVLGNLLDNACKYCLEFIEINAHQSEHQLVITIDDDGPGIPESQRQLIFIRGQRIDTLKPGQGLGLSVSSEIVDQYHGSIVITDGPLGGARIVVTFQQI